MTRTKTTPPGRLSSSTRDETPQTRIFTPLRPLRVIAARAPSGGEIRLLKWQESKHPSVSWYQGKLTAAEDDQFWKAKLLAEKSGDAKWNQARALLISHGWTIKE